MGTHGQAGTVRLVQRQVGRHLYLYLPVRLKHVMRSLSVRGILAPCCQNICNRCWRRMRTHIRLVPCG
jgi:hypothetical protein